MAYTDFFMTPTGNDLNSGSTSADASSYTSTAGNFDGTSLFTPTDGQTTTSFVSVNDWVSLYNTGDTVARAVAQVTAVGAGVNGTITVSTTNKYGTFPVSNSGSRACKKGGAWTSLAICTSPGIFNTAASVPLSTRVNIKAGTYANTTTNRTLSTAGTAQFPFLWQGYKTAQQDQIGNFQGVAGTDIPSFTWTSGSLTIATADTTFSNIDLTSAAIVATLNTSGARIRLQEVRITNTSANAAAVSLAATATMTAVACYFNCPTTATKMVNTTTGASSFHGCIFNGGIAGLLNAISGTTVTFGVFYGQAGDSISSNASMQILHCTFYASTGGNGINITSGGSGTAIGNCYFEGYTTAAKAAINNTSGTNIENPTFFGNAFFNNTANYSGFQEAYQFQDNGTLTASALTAPASQNFKLVSGSQGLGYPGQFEHFSASQGYTSFGAFIPQPGGGVPGNIMMTRGQSFACH